MNDNIYDIIKKYCSDTYIEFESELFKYAVSDPKLYELLQLSHMKNIIMEFCVIHFNKIYKSLILRDDDSIYPIYKQINDINKHNYICILKVFFSIVSNIIMNSDRTTFNCNNYKSYMDSVVQYANCIKNIDIEQLFNHECIHIDIMNCNPNQYIFHIKI